MIRFPVQTTNYIIGDPEGGEETTVDVAAGMCVKTVVRTNYSQQPILKYKERSVDVPAEAALVGNGKWEEVYFVFPADTEPTAVDWFSFFPFGGTNKEDFPEGIYIDIAAYAIFGSLDDAKAVDLTPRTPNLKRPHPLRSTKSLKQRPKHRTPSISASSPPLLP